MSCAETQLRTRVKSKLGWTVTIGRAANITKGINGRGPCHYCGPCEQGCVTHSYFNAAFTTVADALQSGNTTLITNAMVYKVLTDRSTNKAAGVMYIDRVTREVKEVRARAVLLCAQALESARILLNSAQGGLANSSGVLGHYLMDHFMGAGAFGLLPQLGNRGEPLGHRPNGIYVPRFRNLEERHPDFIRGYGFQGGSGFEKWKHGYRLPGFGAGLKGAIREQRYWHVTLVAFGECLARHDNFCELDPEKVDAWGIPVLRIHMTWGDNELRMLKDASSTAREMIETTGAEGVASWASISTPGSGIHEVGTARMGDDPKAFVVNRWQQTHDVDNLFVMDGSVYPSSACQNPTLTIMALAARACDHFVERFRTGDFT
jgi:choline dehydrogenase-like flavoprotein